MVTCDKGDIEQLLQNLPDDTSVLDTLEGARGYVRDSMALLKGYFGDEKGGDYPESIPAGWQKELLRLDSVLTRVPSEQEYQGRVRNFVVVVANHIITQKNKMAEALYSKNGISELVQRLDRINANVLHENPEGSVEEVKLDTSKLLELFAERANEAQEDSREWLKCLPAVQDSLRGWLRMREVTRFAAAGCFAIAAGVGFFGDDSAVKNKVVYGGLAAGFVVAASALFQTKRFIEPAEAHIELFSRWANNSAGRADAYSEMERTIKVLPKLIEAMKELGAAAQTSEQTAQPPAAPRVA